MRNEVNNVSLLSENSRHTIDSRIPDQNKRSKFINSNEEEKKAEESSFEEEERVSEGL